MKIMDGKLVSQATKDELKLKVDQLVREGKKVPHLTAVLVGNNGASETYVGSKVKTCEEIGFKSSLVRLDSNVSEEILLQTIRDLNNDGDVEHISEEQVINTIDPLKDVDGFHPVSVGRLVQGQPSFIPATPYGIMLILEYYKIDTKGMNAVVIGRSNIVGRPISILLSINGNPGNCTVTVCHSHTKNIKEICQGADLIIAALGRPGFLKADMIKEGAIIIDVGITRVEDATKKSGYAIKGDVDYAAVASKCSYITPVPGGVGPMTIAALMKNTFRACLSK
jgi:methylenetetrahydrofolate dehydrogenase (NADP+)/methenyltetrahydrofolate cyclohydrolase